MDVTRITKILSQLNDVLVTKQAMARADTWILGLFLALAFVCLVLCLLMAWMLHFAWAFMLFGLLEIVVVTFRKVN